MDRTHQHTSTKQWIARAGGAMTAVLGLTMFSPEAIAGGPFPTERPIYIAVGDVSRTPMGWQQFCGDHPSECRVTPSVPRDVRLTPDAWRQLNGINDYVNQTIEPATDLEIYGKVEYWAYPVDRGDCEDFVLLKRRMLLDAGWPREALLITVVRDQRDDGHAVLTVRTDHGEFILDNLVTDILPWQRTGYRYVKRQSQSDPNVWIALGDPRSRATVASTDRR